jgi:hypothetical protein
MSDPARLVIWAAPAGARRVSASGRSPARRVVGILGRLLAGLFIAIVSVLAGIGWLYTLRKAGALDAGPRFHEALPLQRLAGNADQPLARLVLAWLPAGLLAGFALRSVGFSSAASRATWMLLVALLLLLLAGAVSDAVTASEPLRDHWSEQPGRAAIWLPTVLVAAGAAIPRRVSRA